MVKRQYPVELKLKIVQESLETGNCAIVARRYGIASNIVNRWTRNYRKYGEAAFNGAGRKCSSGEISNSKEALVENEKLKRLLGKKELEIEILKDLLKKTNPHLQIK